MERKIAEIDAGTTYSEEYDNVKNNWKDMGFDEEPSEQTIVDTASDYANEDVEYQCELISEVMKRKQARVGNKRDDYWYWRVDGSDLGWMRRTGYTYCRADNAKALFYKILPNTDYRLKIVHLGKSIKILCWHHDCPVNPEKYVVTPVTETTYDKYNN